MYLPEDRIFQRHSGVMDTYSSAHTEGRQGILMLNLTVRVREMGFGVNGWEGDTVNEPIHLPSCSTKNLSKEVQTFSQQYVLNYVPGNGST